MNDQKKGASLCFNNSDVISSIKIVANLKLYAHVICEKIRSWKY